MSTIGQCTHQPSGWCAECVQEHHFLPMAELELQRAELLEALTALVALSDPDSIADQETDVRLRLDAESALARARSVIARVEGKR